MKKISPFNVIIYVKNANEENSKVQKLAFYKQVIQASRFKKQQLIFSSILKSKYSLNPQAKTFLLSQSQNMPTSFLSFQQIQTFKQKLQANYYNFAYQLLLLQMRIEQFISDKDHQKKVNQLFIEEITRLMQLYMQAVQVLESSSDQRFKYFGQKIHHLMKKKVVVEQLNNARGINLDKKTLDQVNKAQMEIKKQQHQMQMYFHQEQVGMKSIQELVKKSQIQAVNFQGRIRNHLTSQEKTLEQRIQSRKKRSQAGSVTKFKLGTKINQNGFNIQQVKEKQHKAKERDIRMEYFVDCREGNNFDDSIKTPPKKKLLGSTEKSPIDGYQNRFVLSTNRLKLTK